MCTEHPGATAGHTQIPTSLRFKNWAHFKIRFKNSPHFEGGPQWPFFLLRGADGHHDHRNTPRVTPGTPCPSFHACCRANTRQQHAPGVRCRGLKPGFKKWPTPNHWRHKAAECWGQDRLFFTSLYSSVPRNTWGDSLTHTEGHLAPLQKMPHFKNRFKNPGANNYFSVQRLGSRCYLSSCPFAAVCAVRRGTRRLGKDYGCHYVLR